SNGGNLVTYSLWGAPGGMAIDPNTGQVTWNVPPDQAPGAYTFEVQAADDDGQYDQLPVTAVVWPDDAVGKPWWAGDTLSTAVPVYLQAALQARLDGTIGDGGIGNPLAVNMYQVSLLAGERLTARAEAQELGGGELPNSLDSYLRVFDRFGAELAANNDS